MAEPRSEPSGGGAIVVVPERPGPLIRPDVPSRHGRDELDELIDELFPDTDERPGWFDVGLLVIGLGLLGWATVGGGPTLVAVVGAIAAAVGCILPVRSAWRRVQRARRARHRSATLARGVPMRLSDPSVERLVSAYDSLVTTASAPGLTAGESAIAAGHSALIEAASLLRGRVPDSAGERDYAQKRATAIEELTAALRETEFATRTDVELDGGSGGDEVAAVLQAREELDAIGGFNSLTRLEAMAAEVRARREST